MSLTIPNLPPIPTGNVTADVSIPVSLSETDPKTYKMPLSQVTNWLTTQGFANTVAGYQGFQGPIGPSGPAGVNGLNGSSLTYGLTIAISPVKVFYFKSDNVTSYGVTTTGITAYVQNLYPSVVNPVRFTIVRYDSSGTQIDSNTYNGTGTNYNSISYTATQLGSAQSATVSAVFVSAGNYYIAVDQISRAVDGQNAIIGVLSNYTAALPADSTGFVSDYTSAAGQFSVYSGQNYINPGNVTYTVLFQNNVTGSINSLGLYSVTSLTTGSTSGQLGLQAVYGSVSVSAVFTVTKSKQGTAGSAKLVTVSLNKNIFAFNNNVPVVSSDTVSATVTLQNITPATSSTIVNWTATLYDASNNATDVTNTLSTVASNSAVRVLSVSAFVAHPTAITCAINASILDSSSVTYSNSQTVTRLNNGTNGTNGTNPIVGTLSNDSGAINAASDGTVSTSTSALSGAFNIYSGSTDVTNQATGYGVYAVYNGGGSTLSFIASANDSSAKNIYVVTSIGATLNASFVLSASYAGTIVYKTFTVAKVVAGPKGDTGAGPVYQGAYSSGSVYYYIPGVRADIVLYSGSYYIANNASKSGSAGWGTPGSSSDWTSFGASFSSVATNLLLTQDAVVGRYLNMGGYAGTGSNVTLPNAAIRSYSVSPTISVSRNGDYSTIGITGNGFYLGYPSGTVSTSNNGADAIFFVGDGYGSNSNYMFWNGNNLNLQGNISINPVNNAGVSYGNGIYSGKSGYTDNTNGWWLGVDTDNKAKIYLGNSSNSVKWDGSNLTVTGTVYAGAGSFTGSIYAGAGTIGSWTINSSSITGGSTTINSNGNIYAGQTAYNTGTGWWLGTNGQFSVGNSSSNYLTYSSGTLTVNGTINVTGGNAATQSYADSSANTAYTNAKAVADSIANGSYSGGTLISGKSIFSPVIAGVSGYFSGSMAVGSGSPILLDGANSRIVIAGTGGSTYSTAKFYVGSDGKFGLGQGQVTWDNTTLTVNGTVNATAGYLINGKLASSSGGWNVGSTGQITAGSITLDGSTPYIGIGTTSYNGTGIWMGNSSGTYKFSVGNGSSNYMTWDGSALKVSGDIESTTGHIGGWTIGSSTLYSGNVSLDSGADTITINTGGSSKAVLETASGRARVKVTNTSGNMTGYLQGTYGSGVLDVGALVLLDGSGNSNSVILGSGYATFAGTATAAAFNTTSSRKLKKNIAPITNALAKVIKLQGVTFDWNNKELNNDFGLIAEDVNEVLPTIVGKSETGDVTGVDYGRITALLIETVKELNNKIEVLESKLNNA